MESKYKLTYYDIKGYAEPIRMLFALAKVPYEDIRLPYTVGKPTLPPEFKKKLPFGQVPLLEFDDGQGFEPGLSQSSTISRFLGRRFGVYGKNDLESARVDEIVDAVKDYFELVRAIWLAPNEEQKAAAYKRVFEEATPKYLTAFASILDKNGEEFLVGSSVSCAEIQVHRILWIEEMFHVEIFKNYPKLQTLVQRFEALPQIKEYLENRPVTVY